MSKDTPTLVASKRERTGSRYARRLRAAGKLPAVVYGHGTEPLSIELVETETMRHLTEGAHVVELNIDGAKPETCLVKDLQFGWLGDNVIHLDLTRVDLDEIVSVNVKLNFTGTSEAAKETGSILTYDTVDLEVSCKVRDIPEEIVVNLDEMEESLNVGELTLPDNIEAVPPPETLVCHIVFKAEEEEAPSAVDLEGAEGEVAGDESAPADGGDAAGADDGGDSEKS